MPTIKLWLGDSPEGTHIADVEAETYKDAVLSVLGDHALLQQPSLLFNGLVIYDSQERAIEDYEFRNNEKGDSMVDAAVEALSD